MPTTLVVQLVEPFGRVADVGRGDRRHVRRRRPGPRAPRRRPVSVDADPHPPRTPPVPVLLPGVTMSRLVPSACTCADTCRWAPMPRPTVRITAAMPMRMPSMVSPDRTPVRPDRVQAGPQRVRPVTGLSGFARVLPERSSGRASLTHGRPPPVPHAHHPRRPRGDLSLVRDQHDRPAGSRAARTAGRARRPTTPSRGCRSARRRGSASGPPTSARATADPLLLTAGQLAGPVFGAGRPAPPAPARPSARRRRSSRGTPAYTSGSSTLRQAVQRTAAG